MPHLFYHLGRMVGTGLRKANWVWRSLAGTEAESVEAEYSVGRDLAHAFAQQAQPDPDPDAQALLTDVSARLSATLLNKHWRFTPRCVLDPEPNAFALPGGFLFLTRPLLDLCRADAGELAFVLGHEMAHVVLRHAIDRIMAHTALSAAVRRLGFGGGVLGGSLATLATTLLNRGYSQDQELEADRLAVRLAHCAGFEPSAGARLLARLAGVGGDPAGLSRYFSTHPPFEVRIAQINRAAGG